jgi:hypothetical protein
MDLGAGDPRTAPYSFSSPHIDLAVISFNGQNATSAGRFAADLDRAVHRAVPLEQVGDESTGAYWVRSSYLSRSSRSGEWRCSTLTSTRFGETSAPTPGPGG